MSINNALDYAVHQPLFDRLASNWAMLLLRGLLAVAFGVVATLFPSSAIMTLVILYGVYASADGALLLFTALAPTEEAIPTWWLILAGVVSLAIGIIALSMPGITTIVLSMIIGAWALASGAIQIAGAHQLRQEIDNECLLLVSGTATSLFGLGMVLFPLAGALVLTWTVAFYAMAFGLMWVVLAFELRRYRRLSQDRSDH